ncbi:MAG: hypothetical protein GY753_12005 [Gammaproteobacteria bacterium]|nr:hypothetical protein [Gammaproteobacteria bacterium]
MVDYSKYITPVPEEEEPATPQPIDVSASVNAPTPSDEPMDFSKYIVKPVVPLDKTMHQTVSRTSTPQTEAEIQEIFGETGIPQDIIRQNMDASRTRAEYSTLVTDAQGAPKLLGFIQDPKNLAAVREDIKPLSQVEATLAHQVATDVVQAFEDVPAAWKRGKDVVTRGQMYSELSDALVTGADTEAILERIQEYEDSVDIAPSKGGWMEAAAEMLPIMGHTILSGQEEGLKYAMTGATGAMLMGQAGPQALAMEEVVTVPVATGLMYGAGVKTGAAFEMFNIERGNALAEFMEFKDEEGLPLPPAVANVAAIGVGAINAGLEFLGLKHIPGADKLLGGFTKEAVKKALQDPSVRRTLMGVAKKYAKGVTAETITEMGQEVVNILGGAMVKAASDQEFAPDDIFSPENMSRVLESGEMAFKATVLLGAPGSGYSAVRDVRKTEKQIQDQQAFVEHHTAVNEAIQATETAQSNPVMMEKFLKDTMGLKEQDAFVDNEVILELEQSAPEILDEITQEMGASKEKVLEAAAMGQPIRLNMGAYHARLSPEAKIALFNGMKATPGSYSASQIEAGMAQAADNFEDNYTGFVAENEALNAEISRVEQESILAGAEPRVAAQTAQIAARMAISVADNTEDGNAAELLRKINFGAQQVQDQDVSYDQAGQLVTDSENFRNWFKKSKLVNADGTPRVLWHGTAARVDAFKKAKQGSTTKTPIAKWGFYLTPGKVNADQYVMISSFGMTPQEATETEAKAYYVSMQNPYEMSQQEWQDFLNWGNLESQKYDTFAKARAAANKFKKELVAKGHDGIYIKLSEDGSADEIVAFEPTQIKSVDNKGAWNPKKAGVYQQLDKLNSELAGGLGISGEGIATFDPVKAALGASKTFYQGISSPGKGGRYLRGAAGSQQNFETFAANFKDEDLNEFDGVKSVQEAVDWAANITWLDSNIITTKRDTRWGLSNAKGYDELGKVFYGNDKMAFPNAVYPHGRNTWDIPGCGREAWAVENGIDITQACYGGACYAEALKIGKQGKLAGVTKGLSKLPVYYASKERKAILAHVQDKGFDSAVQEFGSQYELKLRKPDAEAKKQIAAALKKGEEPSLNFLKQDDGSYLKITTGYFKNAKGEIIPFSEVQDTAALAAVVSTKLQPANGADIRLGVDTDGSAWLMHPEVMDAIMKADPRTLTVYSSAYHKPPPAHALSGRTIINVTISGWHPLPETLARIRWAEQARANGWNVILREVVADDVNFAADTVQQYGRVHKAVLATDFFVMLQPLHMGKLHGTTIDNMPGCCVGTETNQHTCDQCEVAEGLGKGFQEYWEIHEERDPANGTGEIVLPDSDYEGRTLYQGARGSVQIFSDRYVVNLFESANESTPFHELGHVFLSEMQSIVDKGAASEQMTADMKVIGDWMDGLDDPEVFQAQFDNFKPSEFAGRDLTELSAEEVHRAAEIMKHEYFARGFESYLMEGKAPAPELIPAFRRFARWLKNVYKHISALDVKLTTPVRNIFDRMLQSEFEVEDSMSDMGLQPLTKKEMDALGILPEDRDYLKRLHQDAQTEAERKLTAARVHGVKQKRPEWEAEADDIIQRDMLNATVHRLKKGQGIDRQTAIETWGKAVIDRMPKGLKKVFKKNGMIPDEVAYEEGYNTAEDLFNALEGWTPETMQKRRYVAQRQTEYQDSLNPDDYLVDTADFAEYLGIIGNYTSGKLGDQAQLEEKLAGKKGSKTVLARSAFRKYAKTIIRDMPVRDAVRTDLFTAAMKKASQGEAAAIKRGDWAAAQGANEQMRLNFEMAQEARRIRVEKEKVERMAKRVKKAKPDKVQADYLGTALQLAQRFGLVELGEAFAPILQKAGDIRTLLVDASDLMGPDEYGFSTELMTGTAPFDYRDLNADELNEVATLIKALVKKGRDAINPKLTSLDITLEEARLDLVLAAGQLKSKTKWAKRGRSYFGIDPTAWLRSLQDKWRSHHADTHQLWSMLRILDGFTYYDKSKERGPFESYFRDNLEKAYEKKNSDTTKYEPMIRTAVQKLFKRGKNRHKMPVWLTDQIPVPVPKNLANDGRGWDFEAVAAVAVNMGNESNLARLKDGYGWTDEQINGIVALLTDEEWDAIQELWDVFEAMRPEFFEASDRIHGVEPPKIVPRPFVTPTGKVMTGGYAPAVYDRSNVRAAELDEKALLRESANAGHQRPSVNARATKSRAVTAGGMPIRLDLSGIARQFDYNLQYTAFAETVRDIARILNDQQVADTIADKVGEEWLPAMRTIMTHVANPGTERTANFTTRMLKGMGSNASKWVLGGNRSVGVKQVFSLPAVYVEGGAWFRGFKHVMGSPKHIAQAWTEMMEMSPNMKQRMEGRQLDREVGKQRQKLMAGSDLAGVPTEIIDAVLFAYIRFFDALATFPAWYGTKQKMERRYGMGSARAIRETDKIIFDTQPITREMDLSNMQLSRNSLSRLLTFFSGFTMKFENRKRVYVRGFLEKKIPLGQFMLHVLVERILPPMLMNLLFTLGAGDDPEPDDVFWDVLLYQVCGFPVVRELAVGVANAARLGYDDDFHGFSPIGSPIMSAVQAVERNMNTLARWFSGDGGDTEAAVAAVDLVLATKGVPAVKIVKDFQESARQFEYSDGFDAWFKLFVKPDPKERE